MLDLQPEHVQAFLWTPRQEVLEEARQAGQFRDDRELFQGANYISPELPEAYMCDLIETLRRKSGYTVQVNKPFATYREIRE